MRRHADEGARIIDRLGFLSDAVPAIRHHHERFDGSGYPDGLHGRGDPARRPHHPRRRRAGLDADLADLPAGAEPRSEALEELESGAGEQFCPRCVRALEHALGVEAEMRHQLLAVPSTPAPFANASRTL